jgi:hypothetical protein
MDRGELVYVFPSVDAFGAAWKIDDSHFALSTTYTGNTETGFLDSHWIRADSLAHLPQIIALLWPCFGSPEDFEFIAQDEAEVRLGMADLPRDASTADLKRILRNARQDWMRREYKLFSMKLHRVSLLPVAMNSGDLSTGWLNGSTRSFADGSAFYDPLVKDARTPLLRSDVASKWVEDLLSSPSFALNSTKASGLAGLVWSKLEQLEWMAGRPASQRERRKGWFLLPEEMAARARARDLDTDLINDEWLED